MPPISVSVLMTVETVAQLVPSSDTTPTSLPASVTTLEEDAFRGCRALYTVELGSGLCEIGDYAFHACDELTEVRFPAKSNIKIGEGNDSLGIQG